MLREIQSHLQSIYRIEAPDIRQFIIDESQLQDITGGEIRDSEEWVLARSTDEGLDLAIYVATVHLEDLERSGSLAEAAHSNFRAFCMATEGVSHFLMLVERARREEPVTMLELEAQAEVDKFVSACLHHPLRTSEWWVRLFRDASLMDGLQPDEVHRYHEAGRLAAAFCSTLDEAPHVDALLHLLRRFWRDSGAQRLERMRRLAA
jgi:hypothetical protein